MTLSVYVVNKTDATFSTVVAVESECINDNNSWESRKDIISDHQSSEIGKFHFMTSLATNVNVYVSIYLFVPVSSKQPDFVESPTTALPDQKRLLRSMSDGNFLILRLRGRGTRTHNQLLYSLMAFPYGTLKPEQIWHSNRSMVKVYYNFHYNF